MRTFTTVIFGLLFPALVWAQSSGRFDQAKWQELQNFVLTEGQMTNSVYGVFVTLSEVVPPDLTKEHRAEYLSAVGGFDENGNFVAREYHAVSEAWTLQDGNWNIDQWILVSDTEGQLFRGEHRLIVEGLDGRVYDVRTFESSATELLSKWNEKLNEWESRIPR